LHAIEIVQSFLRIEELDYRSRMREEEVKMRMITDPKPRALGKPEKSSTSAASRFVLTGASR
jgi:hypothetical protein